MSGKLRHPLVAFFVVALVATVPIGCGGGGGGGGGGAGGGAVDSTVTNLTTPLGAQGNLGDASSSDNDNVELLFNLASAAFQSVDIKVEFAADWNGDGVLAANEWRTATEGPGSAGTTGLATSPGAGERHKFVWDSLSDIASERFATVDNVYDDQGRIVRDADGVPLFVQAPGVRVRMTVLDAGSSARSTSPFDVSNNSLPSIGAVRTVGLDENVSVFYTPIDANLDDVTISVDYSTDAGTTWMPATPAAGTQTTNIPTSATAAGATEQEFVWNSIADVGTTHAASVLVRVTPLDAKNEHGPATELPAPIEITNYSIFTDVTADMGTPRVDHVATRLASGRVLITGGRAAPSGTAMTSAEIFFPSVGPTTTGAFADTSSTMNAARASHTATRLYDGTVLVAGGVGLDTAELYDPITKTFTSTAAMKGGARSGATAVLLVSGKVLVAGGVNGSTTLSTTEIYDPATKTFTAGPSMMSARSDATAVVLGDQRVLIPGGTDSSGGSHDTAEIYDPMTNSFLPLLDLDRARRDHAVVTLLDGSVLLAGGQASPSTATMERFDPTTDSSSATTATMAAGRTNLSASLLGSGKVLLVGGMTDAGLASAGSVDQPERWNPTSDEMEATRGGMSRPRAGAATATLANGKPVYFGGLVSATAATADAEVYTVETGVNALPTASVVTPSTPEFPSLGIRIRYTLTDAEGDAARCRFLYSVDGGKTFHACTSRATTILGDVNDGTDGLTAAASGTEHLFLWDAKTDVGQIDNTQTRVRIIPAGAETGASVETNNFEMKQNAPVIAQLADLSGDQTGAIEFDFTLLDSDDDTATVEYQYGVDSNGNGLIDGTESWNTMSLATGSTGTSGLDTLKDDKKVPYTLIWDSIEDVGAPRDGRTDIIVRISPADADPGIFDEVAAFSIITDPSGQFLVSWHPEGESALSPTQTFSGDVELDRPIVFNFNADVEPGSVDNDTIQIHASPNVDGYYDVSGKTVTFYPQVPDGQTLQTMTADTSYEVFVPGYDPNDPVDTVEKKGGTSGNLNSLVNLLPETIPGAFTTNDEFLADTSTPSTGGLDTPSSSTGVSAGTSIVVTFDEPLDPSTVNAGNVIVTVAGSTMPSVVPAKITVMNVVGPDAIDKAVITIEPLIDLPKGATIDVEFTSGLKDLAGNAVGASTESFGTEDGTASSTTKTLTFSSTTNRDADETTAYWGTDVSGKLNGLDDGGDGSDGALTVSSGTTTLSGTKYQFTTITIAANATLKFSATSPVELFANREVIVAGTIDFSGGNGENAKTVYSFGNNTPSTEHLTMTGGTGVAGGKAGGGGSLKFNTNGTYGPMVGGDGVGSGGGKGGQTRNFYLGPGGAGGSYGSAGQAGQNQCSSSYGQGGAAGSTYGDSKLTSRLAGSGGGCGGGGTYNPSSSTKWAYSTGAGGAGGGSLKIVTNGKLDIKSTGKILGRGGNGGLGYRYGAGGGGASGGDFWAQAGGGVVKDGVIDLSGGDGGTNTRAGTSTCFVSGGNGGGGRLRLDEAEGADVVVSAVASAGFSGDLSSISDGGSLAGDDGKFAPNSNITLTTSASKSVWYFTEFNLKSGVTLTIAGDREARIYAEDGITVNGVINANGGTGTNGAYRSSGSVATSSGGKPGAGGERGGRTHTGSNTLSSPPSSEDGQGDGGGEAGNPSGAYSTSSSFTRYYYPGTSGGGSSVAKGGNGFKKSVSSIYKAGAGGLAGDALGGSAASLDDDDLPGGSGGGAGPYGGFRSSGRFFKYQNGTGGGGGGKLVFFTPKTFAMNGGTINAKGGTGGRYATTSTTYGAHGAGASGGGVYVAAGDFDIPIGTFDFSGGSGGKSVNANVASGDGSIGALHMASTSEFSVLNLAAFKTGSFYGDFFAGKDTGVSTWNDTGALNPTYASLGAVFFPTSGSQGDAWLEVAQSDPVTGEVDLDTVVRLTPAEVAAGKADGCRYFRFVMKIYPGTEDPTIDDVEVTFTKLI